MNFEDKSITITYGDCAENHNGMQIIGQMSDYGFSIEDIQDCKTKFESIGVVCELIKLNDYVKDEKLNFEQAQVLVVRQGINYLLKSINKSANDMFNELVIQDWDKKVLMYGRVVNKKARYNICISDISQKADFASGKGTILEFNKLECCNEIRKQLPKYLNKSENLFGEGNYYYNKTCGIGFHGDSERRKVVAIKLGNVKPLVYQWYHNGDRIGDICEINLAHGDMYIMSEKAVGTDWKKKSLATLRHATGSDSFIK